MQKYQVRLSYLCMIETAKIDQNCHFFFAFLYEKKRAYFYNKKTNNNHI